VHVVERGGREERRTLAFRDYLRADPVMAREYETLKRTIAQRVGTENDSQERYAVAKTEFVERVVALAMAQGYPLEL
jgi:GrpB-like predicted nucleotidyltransferase (UPF0157 family)